MLGLAEFVCPRPVELTAKLQTSNPLTAPGSSIAQSEMMRPEVNICFCFILITLISCKPEEHMKQNVSDLDRSVVFSGHFGFIDQ
jgi:hypothetical protein